MSAWIEAGSAGCLALGLGDAVAVGLVELAGLVGLASAEVPAVGPPDAAPAPDGGGPVTAPVWSAVAERADESREGNPAAYLRGRWQVNGSATVAHHPSVTRGPAHAASAPEDATRS